MLNLYFLTESVKMFRLKMHHEIPRSRAKELLLCHFYFPKVVLYFNISV